MKSVTIPAYAKVNLFLDVVGKRPDGYHTLVTLFERVDLADQLTLEWIPQDRVEVRCDHPEVPQDGTNLVARAAQGYRKAAGITQGLRVTLEKRIPVGGGLGGGSSDAAATLLGLQQLTENRLDRQQLVSLGQQLGADVPFFLCQRAWALGRGRGDLLTPLESAANLWHLLIFPKFPVPTRQVYGAFVLTGDHPDVRMLIRALRDQTQVPRVRELLFNALEPTVEHLYPALRDVKRTLQMIGLERPLVCGSGATVMAVCGSRTEAQEAAQVLQERNPGWEFFVTSTMG
jgi:4-diphosphocytidyl-2-C-methyl-D-erythritol kinase